MEEDEIKKLRDKILKEINDLKASIVSLEEASKPVAPDVAIGRLTRMEAISSKGISDANLRSSKSRLSGLKSSLGRLNDPDFGICIDCEEPIATGRLFIMPESRRCVECAGRGR